MNGILYGVGTGPGDPELMTLRAVRLIRENAVIACAGKDARASLAYRIALQAVPELADKTILSIDMPMTRDRDILIQSHRVGADLIESHLKVGKNVVFLTLGDPTIYSGFSYLQKLVTADGFPTETVSGVTSFCAAAASLNLPLVTGEESLCILPAAQDSVLGNLSAAEAPDAPAADGISCTPVGAEAPDAPAAESISCTPASADTLLLMKAGRAPGTLAERLRSAGYDVSMVENCGLAEEKLYREAESIPEHAGYFSLMIAKRTRG